MASTPVITVSGTAATDTSYFTVEVPVSILFNLLFSLRYSTTDSVVVPLPALFRQRVLAAPARQPRLCRDPRRHVSHAQEPTLGISVLRLHGTFFRRRCLRWRVPTFNVRLGEEQRS